MAKDIYRKFIDDIYEEYLGINLMEEMIPQERKFDFEHIINNYKEFVFECKEFESVLIGVEQFPDDWSIKKRVAFMAETTKDNNNISYLVSSAEYKIYEAAIYKAIKSFEEEFLELFKIYESKYFLRIDDHRKGIGAVSYIGMSIGGEIRVLYEDAMNVIHKSEYRLGISEYEIIYDAVASYMKKVANKPLDLIVDDRSFFYCFVAHFDFDSLGYKINNTTDQSLYFDYESGNKGINMLRDYYLDFVNEIDKKYEE